MEAVHVSTEMVTLLTADTQLDVRLPTDPVAFAFVGMRLSIFASGFALSDFAEGFALIIARDTLARLFDWDAQSDDGRSFYLSHELRVVADALLSRDRSGPALIAYRLGKSLELLCDAVRAIDDDMLVPLEGAPLTFTDTKRILKARRIIDERWHEQLTLAAISRACGVNRAKLTRGFRTLYKTSVAEALLDRRLAEARRALLTTDLPVGQVAYRNGYLNNASFTRAFGRRYGQSPSDCRARVMQA